MRPNGEIWAALGTGRLIRLSWPEQAHAQTTVDVRLHLRASVRSLLVLDHIIVAGSERGELVVFDQQGREIGRDDLGVDLGHLSSGLRNLILASTGRGPAVFKLAPSVLIETEQAALRERALQTVIGWEALVARGAPQPLSKVFGVFFQALDLARWPEVVAYQHAVLLRRQTNPVAFRKIEAVMESLDPRKTACLCTRTRPVFIDGSNVSRDHWKGTRDENRRSRLGAILDMQLALSQETNPVLYPMITVVDVSERHWIDDHAELVRLIEEEQILETPTTREADALILNLIRKNGWLDCEIVSNDKHLFEDHKEMLPEGNDRWYDKARRAFVIQPKTGQVSFVPQSR